MKKRKIILILQGGLGNQLFQYAMARSCMGFNDSLIFHTEFYENDSLKRKFGLNYFKIKGTAINRSQSWFLKKTPKYVKKFLIFSNILLEITELDFFFHNVFDIQIKHFTIIKGFWQSEEYFRRIGKELRLELEPKHKIILPNYISRKLHLTNQSK